MDDWLNQARIKIERMPEEAKEIRQRALDDLWFFANLVNPGYMYGSKHKEIYYWLQEYHLFGLGEGLTSNKLLMLPRGHLKSHIVATWCAWIITRHPEVTIFYSSATASLAEIQLYAIQNIIGSTVYQRYFPEYINPQEGKREKWSVNTLTIDHIKRKQEGIRDATITTAGLTTNTTGWHADVIIADDLVVPENAYTEEGRESVSRKSSQFTSIRNPGGFTLACGTRYHPKDIYFTWASQYYEEYSEEGDLIDRKPVWEIKEHPVEMDGVFLWPRIIREDGKAFGFDKNILSRIKAEYSDTTQFFAQYYNDPNDPSSNRLSKDKFQYYDRKHLHKEGSKWYFKDKKLNIYAAVDFAFSLKQKADFTAIVVIGVDSANNIYVLDIDRFKSNKPIEYFKHIASLHSKWIFTKLRAEVTVAQTVIVESIKDYIKQEGMTLPIDDYRPHKKEGSKEERIIAALEPKYDNRQVWHYEGGWTNVLEEELVQSRPAHDDIKDAFASAVTIAIAPKVSVGNFMNDFFFGDKKQKRKSRFGGF